MEKISSISSSKITRGGFLVFAALAAAFEIFISLTPKYKLSEPPYEYIGMEMKASTADSGKPFDIVILGDCTGWAGIRPADLKRELGVRAYNFCGNAYQTYLVNYVTLGRYLARCKRPPRLAIVQLSAMSLLWRRKVDFGVLRDNILPFYRMDTDLLDELDSGLRREYFKYRVLTLLPSVKNQYFLREGLWFTSMWRNTREDYEKHLKYYKEEDGFYNEEMDPRKQRVEKIEDIGDNFKMFSVSSYNLSYIRRILAMLAEAGIPVVVCTVPVRRDEMALWDRYDIRNRVNALIRRELEGYGNIKAFWDMADEAADKRYYIDATHLNMEGAHIYTGALAEKLKQLDIR